MTANIFIDRNADIARHLNYGATLAGADAEQQEASGQ